MIPVDTKEVYRYLSVIGKVSGQKEGDEALDRLVNECIGRLDEVATPKHIYKCFEMEEYTDGIRIPSVDIKSKNLLKNLSGCRSVYMLAATIGAGVDRLIGRALVEGASVGVVMQAAAAAMIESVVDMVDDEIKEKAKSEGFVTRPRFSPGYGDFALLHQKDFIRILEMPKTIGVSLTDSLLMTPSKSVTAIIGVSEE